MQGSMVGAKGRGGEWAPKGFWAGLHCVCIVARQGCSAPIRHCQPDSLGRLCPVGVLGLQGLKGLLQEEDIPFCLVQ